LVINFNGERSEKKNYEINEKAIGLLNGEGSLRNHHSTEVDTLQQAMLFEKGCFLPFTGSGLVFLGSNIMKAFATPLPTIGNPLSKMKEPMSLCGLLTQS
jgi:hypothetical protein